MRRRLALLLSILLAFALVAAACGNDDDGGDTGSDASADTAGDDSGDSGDDSADTDGGDDSADTDGDDSGDDSADTDGGDDSADTDGDDSTSSGDSFPNYDDPRGEPFTSFAASFDRNTPFSSLDDFCVAHDAAAELTDSDDGITAESITIVHIRSRLEQLGEIGFAIPVGDPALMFQVFADYVNENCGGVRGRQIDLKLVEVDTFNPAEDIDALRNEACIRATEDEGGVIVMNSTGFQGSATLCIAEEHNVAFITTQGNSQEFSDRAEGRLVSLSPTLGESLTWLSGYAIDQGLLDGKTIGVIAPDTPGQAEAVEDFLVTPLRDAGFDVPVFDIIGCQGSTTCTQGIQESVSNLIDNEVDFFFPTLNVVSWPSTSARWSPRASRPATIEFMNSDFNSQAGDLVSSKVVAFGGAAAGELYNGAIIVDDAATGDFRDPNFEERPFNIMCNRTYAENGGEVHDPFDPVDNGPYGMVTTVCTEMRMALQAIYLAGDNPTRDQIFEQLANLGPIDGNNMLPSSLAAGKPSSPDAIHAMEFTYPCVFGEELGFGEENTCIVPVEGDQWVPRTPLIPT